MLVKRETGERPVRTRHCEIEAVYGMPLDIPGRYVYRRAQPLLFIVTAGQILSQETCLR